MSLVAFLVVIAICVMIHEWGHFITARLMGVQVHEFAFGMGPVLKQKQWRDTMWSLRIFPIGGFVRLAGMGEEREDETVRPGEDFPSKKPWQRFLILCNGAVLNILLALVLTMLLLSGHGVLDMNSTKIGEVMPGYPAATSELEQGDSILSVNGKEVTDWNTMAAAIRDAGTEHPVRLEVQTGDGTKTMTVPLKANPESGVPLLGIRPSMKRYGILASFSRSFTYLWDMSSRIIGALGSWITGRQSVDVTGPVGIAEMAGKAARQGIWPFLSFLAVINLHLGILNLLPFPALDGGRIFFVLGEMITGKRLPERWEYYIHLAGFVILISLILVITWKDVVSLWG